MRLWFEVGEGRHSLTIHPFLHPFFYHSLSFFHPFFSIHPSIHSLFQSIHLVFFSPKLCIHDVICSIHSLFLSFHPPIHCFLLSFHYFISFLRSFHTSFFFQLFNPSVLSIHPILSSLSSVFSFRFILPSCLPYSFTLQVTL